MRHFALTTLTACVLILGAAPASAHYLDHPYPVIPTQPGPLSTSFLSGGIEGTTWEYQGSLADGNPHSDLDFFTQGDNLYASSGTLAFGANGGGQTIVQLRAGDEFAPAFISALGTASCASAGSGVTGLQHDVEATPKGDVMFNTIHPTADRRDAQLLIDATDADGRCHDNAFATLPGSGAPNGGLEFIDIRDITAPFELVLTTHVGEAHTVNVDPKRPHIVFVSSSDGGDIDEDGNVVLDSTFQLHTMEIVDISTCLDLDPASSILERRTACDPVVYRMEWEPDWTRSSLNDTEFGACHEVEIYPDDRFTCAGLDGTVVLDLSGAFDDNGTPDDFLDDTVNGTPLPCDRRASTSQVSPTAAAVIDCVDGADGADLTFNGWRDLGSPAVQGVELVGFVNHVGGNTAADVDTTPGVSIAISHEAELTGSGDFVLVTDERGGGALPPGASCDPADANSANGNGGIHAFRTDRLMTEVPSGEPAEVAAASDEAYARTPSGEKAVLVVPVITAGPTFCTAHIFHQIPGQNRLFMAWYSQGTHVVDFVEHEDGTFEFIHIAYFVPENANTWTAAVYDFTDNGDGSFTYYGATSDLALGAGRGAIDLFAVTLPAPAQVAADTGQPLPEPVAPPDPSEPAPQPEETPGLPATGAGAVPAALAMMGLAGLGHQRWRRARHS